MSIERERVDFRCRVPPWSYPSRPRHGSRGVRCSPPGLAVFRMVANAETAFRPWLALGGALLGSLQLDPVLRELAILHVAVIAECDYERVQHEAIATGVGTRPDQSLRSSPGASWRAVRSARGACPSLRRGGGRRPRRHVGRRAQAALSAREVVELLLVITHYHGLALLLNTTGVEPDPPAAMAVVEAAQANRDVQP